MSAGGKGDAPRPFGVTKPEFDSNWDRIFGKKTPPDHVPDATKMIEQQGAAHKTPLRMLDLTLRSHHLLKRGRIYDIETLQSTDPKDVLAIPGIGKKSLSEIMHALTVYEQTRERKVLAENLQSIKAAGEPAPALTDDEIWHIYGVTGLGNGMAVRFARAIEAKLKEKGAAR